jgi:hypothetical protein
MKKYTLLLFLVVPFALTGCYHAQITTGLEASNEVYQEAWATSFIGGLVPPSIVNAEQHCSNGVARVETRLSFLNMVATLVTFNLYSPMEITVTCASASADNYSGEEVIELAKNSAQEDVIETFNKAAELSASEEKAIYVSFK